MPDSPIVKVKVDKNNPSTVHVRHACGYSDDYFYPYLRQLMGEKTAEKLYNRAVDNAALLGVWRNITL